MSLENPLARAHALSAQASALLRPPNTTIATLQRGKELFQTCLDTYLSAADKSTDQGEKKTLQLLVSQHRKFIKDVERRIATLQRAAESPPAQPLSTGTPYSHPMDQNSLPFSIAPLRPPPPSQSPLQGVPYTGADPTQSPLYSSSSSSEPPDGESYVNFGAIPATLDPFSRFWGMLDNMLEDISNPVAFATADVGPVVVSPEVAREIERRKEKNRRKEEKRAAKGKERPSSPSDSYYVIRKEKIPDAASLSETQNGRNGSPSGKTPEELALENENLRASLDALAVHAETLEKDNRALRLQAEERKQVMQKAVMGVRKEARKVKQDSDLLRSQLFGSTVHSPIASREIFPHADDGVVSGLRKRVKDLETEVKTLKEENIAQRASAQKYRDKLDRIKVSSREKKEARAAAERNG